MLLILSVPGHMTRHLGRPVCACQSHLRNTDLTNKNRNCKDTLKMGNLKLSIKGHCCSVN